VKIYFFNIAISGNTDRYKELISREKFLIQIDNEYTEFLEQYKLDPINELCNLFSLDINTIPDEYEKKNTSKLAHRLLVINKGFKKKILNLSNDTFTSSWMEELKETTLNFLKWISTTIIVVGFIKAFLYSQILDIPLSLLFSIQDYLDYGVSSSLFPFFFIIIMIFLLAEYIFLGEYSNFNYTKRIEDKYDFGDAKETKPIHLFICIFGIILCFISRNFVPDYYIFFESILFIILLFFAIFIFGFLSGKTDNMFLVFSIICIIFSLIYNLWMIPKSLNPKYAQSNFTHKLEESVDLPPDAFFVDTTSKYYIFSSADSIFLVPIDKILYSKKTIND
jgi:hypothetical protein